ncbi:MAG: VOC family protein [Methanobacteriota archaeon]
MGVVQDIGHVTLEVGDMEEAIRFYRDVLGLEVTQIVGSVWAVLTTKGGAVTLYRKKDPSPCAVGGDGSPFNFHVANVDEARRTLEGDGCTVRHLAHNIISTRDRWGNVLMFHDHREG